jgi:hypothetical protein
MNSSRYTSLVVILIQSVTIYLKNKYDREKYYRMPPYNFGTRTTYGVEDRGTAVRFPTLVDISFLFQRLQSENTAHPTLAIQEVRGAISSRINLSGCKFHRLAL